MTAKVTAAPFAFGSIPSTTAASSLATPAFTFGASKTTANVPAAQSSAPFMFGAALTSTPAVSTTIPAVSSGSGFSAVPAFSFGAPAATPAPSVQFTFGATNTSATATAPATSLSPFMFGGGMTAVPVHSSTPPGSFSGLSADGSNIAIQGTASYGTDSPSSTMDTGYTSGDAANMGFPPALLQIPPPFSNGPAPFAFGAPVASAGSMGSSLPPFGASSQPSFGSSFGSQSAQSQPFSFGAVQQPQVQASPAFGFGPGIAGGAFGQQPLQQLAQPAFSFGAPQVQSQPLGMSGGFGGSSGMGQMGPAGGGGGGGFSMGAAAAPGVRRKIKAKRPGQ